jgi:predicted SnoaL-like aldol condensation-catalyzing enzyme
METAMKLNQLIASAAIITTLPLTVQADNAGIKALVLEAGNVDAVDQYFAKDIIQHNELFANGIDAQKGAVAFLAGSCNFRADYVRVIADGNLVAVHARYEGFGETPMVAFDLFRVENGKIAEHWDNLISEQPANPSGRTQLDGPTEITDHDKTDTNKAKVKEFLTRALVNHEKVDFTQYINSANYHQHNPMVADGLDGFGAFMA